LPQNASTMEPLTMTDVNIQGRRGKFSRRKKKCKF
jgi:hypothetical protein